MIMEFRPSTFLIGIILFSIIVVGLAIPFGDLGDNYDVTIDASFNETYNKIQIVDNRTIDIGEEVRGNGEISTFDAFFLAGKAILSSARIVFTSFGVVTQLIFDLGSDFGIPSVFTTALGTILLLAIVFAIISLWARFKA